MRLIIEGGLTPDQEGYDTQQRLLGVFETALVLAVTKERAYRGAWRSQGWMGNLARLLSKASRMKAMLWRDMSYQNDNEPVEDTALDMINLAAFFIENRRSDNKWGDRLG